MGLEKDEAATARAIIDANVYMTLGTADAAGTPWASPVFYSADGYADFYWMSATGARHSVNIAERERIGIVVFDSNAPVSTGQAVYMSAVARELTGADLEHARTVYPGPPERGGRPISPEDVLPPAPRRLFHAAVSEHSILCPRPVGEHCGTHGNAFDHRTPVDL
ncbi:pyridoxamine 5'-phosphate oxidase family protein [Spirillospora sp. NPDC047279]|uniref:pyridoxamine 5'-phosphate oxidase family protein n=1 Tax=Spirillospora sp. NPDC047279 TaxID=3155478 RepID=UPI0033EC3544